LLTDLGAASSAASVIAHLSALLPRHLPVCATLRDPDLAAAAAAHRRTAADAFRAAAACEVLHDLEVTRRVLSSRGVLAIDAEADRLLPLLIARYLDIKARGRL
jgi:uncharacterized protein (DUF58 family)